MFKKLKKGFYIASGSLFVIIGLIGIFLPLLPTTPFLLLAAVCYARGSKKMHYWLLNNKWFGQYIRGYTEKRGIPLKAKLFSIGLLWCTITISLFFFVSNPIIQIILLIVAVSVTAHLLTLKTLKIGNNN